MDKPSKFYDERYEFDAPRLYIDFTNFHDDDSDDSFFDRRSMGQRRSLPDLTGKGESSAPKASTDSRDVPALELKHGTPVPDTAVDAGSGSSDATEAMVCDGDSVPCNEAAHKSEETVSSEADQHIPDDPQPVSELHQDNAEHMETEQVDEVLETAEKRLTRSSRKGPLGNDGVFQQPPMRHSPRLAAIAKALNVGGGARNSSSGFKGRRRSASAGPAHRAAKPKGGSGSLSVEERAHLAQFTQLAEMATSVRDRQRSSSRVYPGGARPKTTKPVEFHFATYHRHKGATKPTTSAAAAADFAKTLRSCAKNAASHAPRGPTKPQPFNLSEGKKVLTDDGDQQKNKFVSLAELNMKFHSHTPQRFRTKPRNEDGFQQKKGTQSCSSSSVPHTRPQSPYLSTRSRSRPVNHPTREQLEEQELAEAQKHQVKAHPLNPKIFEAPKLNAIPVKPITQPEPFNITATKKELATAVSMSIFSDMLDDSLGWLPHAGVPPRQERISTKVQPFSFDTRDQRMLRRKQEKIEETIAKEKALAEFHALPMPVFDGGPKGLPGKKPPSATKPTPFELQIDKRAEARRRAVEREQEEREQRERELRSFHARAATVVSKPERSNKPLTDISAFELNTEKRSKERHEFDLHVKQREDKVLVKKRQEEERRVAEEEARIAEERKRKVHKAKPVPQYKLLQIHPSEKPITAPVSPKFATDGRLRSSRSRLNINATINTTVASSHSASSHDSTVPR